MKKSVLVTLVLLALLTGFGERKGHASDERGGQFQVGVGSGFALNKPVRFDEQLEAELFISNNVSVGLNVDFLIGGFPQQPGPSATAFAFIPFARYHFEISRAEKWDPYVGGGIGGIVDTNGFGALDLMIPNFGFRYELVDSHFFLGTDLSMHILSDSDFTNSYWDFRCLIVTATYRF